MNLCDTRVNEWYMNEPRSHMNKSDLKYTMTKKYLTELKVATCTNKTSFFVQWFDHRNYVRWLFTNFFKMHVSEDKQCWKNSYLLVGILFTLKRREVGNLTMLHGMPENVEAIRCQIWIPISVYSCTSFILKHHVKLWFKKNFKNL